MKQGQFVGQLQNVRVQITGFVNQEGTIFYNIIVVHMNLNKFWKLKARYSILSELNDEILKYVKKYKSIQVQIPPFPPKKWWVVQDDSFLHQRKNELQQYLQELFQQEDAFQIEPLVDFLGHNETDDVFKEEISINDKLNLLRDDHNIKQHHNQNSSSSSNTIRAHYEQSEEQDKLSQDNEISFPLSFCEISMGTRNQVVYLGSFSEEIQSIRRKSIGQSDFDDNSSIMMFFPSPPNLKQVIPLVPSRYGREESLIRSQIENQKSNRSSSQLTTQENQQELDQSENNYQNVIQQAMNCINNKNKTVQPNVYSYNLEEYKATQRKFRREVEQIIESSEISSGIEQNIFVDSDEESIDENDSYYQRKQEILKNQRQNQNEQQQSKSQCRCYNSASDDSNSDEDENDDDSSSIVQKSYTKSFLQNVSNQNPTPIMQRSTDDDCANNKRRSPKPKSQQSSNKKKNPNIENILQFLQNSSESLDRKSSTSQAEEQSINDSTKTIYKNEEEEDEDQNQENNSRILKEISQSSFSQRSPTLCIQQNNYNLINSFKNNNQQQFVQNLIKINE